MQLPKLLLNPGAGCAVAKDKARGDEQAERGEQKGCAQQTAAARGSQGVKAERDERGREGGQNGQGSEAVAVDRVSRGEREREAGAADQGREAEQRGTRSKLLPSATPLPEAVLGMETGRSHKRP